MIRGCGCRMRCDGSVTSSQNIVIARPSGQRGSGDPIWIRLEQNWVTRIAREKARDRVMTNSLKRGNLSPRFLLALVQTPPPPPPPPPSGGGNLSLRLA